MNELSVEQRQQITDYHLGLLDEDEAQQVRALLEESEGAREFLKQVEQTLEPLNHLPEPRVPDTLVPLTLARVRSAAVLEGKQEADGWAGTNRGRSAAPRSLGRMPEILTMAASIALVVGLLIPAVKQWRQQALRSSCAGQLASIGSSVRKYAEANLGELPYLAENVGSSWLRPRGTGQKRTNTSNLFRLVKLGYAKPKLFVCPAIKHDPAHLDYAVDKLRDFPSGSVISYSYQNMFGKFRPSLKSPPGLAILADRNPLLSLGPRPTLTQVFMLPSPNHPGNDGRRFPYRPEKGGQNILYLGGFVQWSVTARAGLKNDNIWQPASMADNLPLAEFRGFRGLEVPVSDEDAFLVGGP